MVNDKYLLALLLMIVIDYYEIDYLAVEFVFVVFYRNYSKTMCSILFFHRALFFGS